MDTLEGLLQGIVAGPLSEDRWLVLADWLEERDDPRRGELLRLHRRLLATCREPHLDPQRGQWQARLAVLLGQGVKPCVPLWTVLLGKRTKLPMTFALVPAGSFLMGSPVGEEGRDRDEGQHGVQVPASFWMGVYPVTQAQWRWAMGRNRSRFQGEERPVDRVSWEDCQKFCTRLGKKTGQQVRLPTEAEWEWACRGGTTTPFCVGPSINALDANYSGLALYDQHGLDIFRRETSPVGSFPPNPWGLYDMHGNVWEWCQNPDGGYANAAAGASVNPVASTAQVLRGGSWSNAFQESRSASRLWDGPRERRDNYGCRVVLCLTRPSVA